MTRLSRTPFILAAALAAIAGSAAVAAPQSTPADVAAKPARTCFFASNIDGYGSNRKGTVDVRVGVRDVYRLQVSPGCSDISFPLSQIALVSKGGGSICDARDVEFVVRAGAVPQRCIATSMRKLTPAEIKDPRNAAP
ncbi:DUF6491 family protein [Phenylobacterium deserti]|uniref:Uncharacterized protein n=1 Tax=Phenylobacterium deserti TaxID=1914756 RepID=A0A328ARS0_9CAUL|nr:DUF6491 family protein [Phenylobacterium deserti]RAK57005.1 hypothetical protein DJ018_03300 [Phenylobacterium deserti]